MFFSKTHQSSLNLKFFLKSTRPSFIDKVGCIRQFESELSLRSLAQLFPIKEGSTAFPKPLFSWRRLAALGNMKANFHCAHLHNLSPQGTRDVPTALLGAFFRKPTRPSLPLRKAPHLSPSLSLLRRERMCQPPFQWSLRPLRFPL